MLRWVIVCALLAQTLALSRPNRRAWPDWMDMFKSSRRLSTLDDLPKVTIPDIDWPEVTIPDIDWPELTIPDIDWPELPTQLWGDVPYTQRSDKPRKQRPQPREGPPQRRKLIRANTKFRKTLTGHRQSVPRTEPSMMQQVDEFRSGMPLDMQEQLNDTFDSIKRKLGHGSLMMDSWADDINTAAQEWWSKWMGKRNTDFRPRDRTHNPPRHRNPYSHGESRYPSDSQLNKGRRRNIHPPTEEPSREEPVYEVLCGGNDYEARMYNSSVWVSVTVKALTYDIAANKAFMKLFDYINGNNMNSTEIPMTIPVHSRVKWNSKERRWFERHNYTISFYLPEDLHDNPPAPNNPELFIEYEAPAVYYAHTFRGYARGFNIREYLEELTNTLDASQEYYKTEDFWVNVYDSPWKSFNRHNDILVAMDTNLQNAPRCIAPTTEMPMTSTAKIKLTGGILGEITRDEHTTSQTHDTYGIYRPRDRTYNPPRHRNPHRPHSRGESRYPSDSQLNKGRRNTRCRRPFRPPTEEPSREEPVYEVMCGGNDYEARMYNSSVWVSVTVKALTYDIAAYQAFRKLFDYINGNNMNGTEIPMTIPVRSRVKWNSKERRWFERHNYTISFYLPEDLHDNPPTPNNPELFIEYEAPAVYYAHTFRGYALEFNIWEYLEELTNTLDVSQEYYKKEDFWVNVYDSPWKLFNRHNDILVAMDTNLQNAPRCMIVPTTGMPMTSTATNTTGWTSSVTNTMTKTTTKITPTESPTTVPTTDSELVPLPAEINYQGLQNPFENNDLEQQLSVRCEPGSECPSHSTYVTYDGFELRHYAYSRWICIDQAACDIERAQEITLGLLLEYFYPKGNREQINMSPTTPLVIGLDVADLNSTDCSKVYTSCMFIPEEHQSAPPTPRDARLFIEDIPAMSRYVKSFGGFATSQNVPKLGVEFLMELEKSQQLYDGSILAVAQYTTSKMAKTRINELWVMDQSLLYGDEFPLA